MGGPVVLASEPKQASPRGRQADGVDEVLQHAVLHVLKRAAAQRLLQEEANQRGLECLVAELTEGLQDAGDPQVVVVGSEKTKREENEFG